MNAAFSSGYISQKGYSVNVTDGYHNDGLVILVSQ